jgi:hypothetical protein
MEGVEMTNTPQRLKGSSHLSFRKELDNRGIVFSYSGFLNEDILTGIGNALRTKLVIDKTDAKVSRGLFSAFVEQVQNVIRYSAEKSPPEDEHHDDADPLAEHESLPYGMVTIGEYPDGTRFIACCNMIHSKDSERLSTSLESIKGLDKKQLGAMMREQLRNGPPEGSKGAGVGFISIAREANGNWEYDIIKNVTDQFDFFCFEAHF